MGDITNYVDTDCKSPLNVSLTAAVAGTARIHRAARSLAFAGCQATHPSATGECQMDKWLRPRLMACFYKGIFINSNLSGEGDEHQQPIT